MRQLGFLEWAWKPTILCQIQLEIVVETSIVVTSEDFGSIWAQVCLPPVAEILSPGNVKAFVVELAAPSMRHLREPQCKWLATNKLWVCEKGNTQNCGFFEVFEQQRRWLEVATSTWHGHGRPWSSCTLLDMAVWSLLQLLAGCDGEVGPPSCPAHRVHGRLEGADLRRAAGPAGGVTGDTDSKKTPVFYFANLNRWLSSVYMFFSSKFDLLLFPHTAIPAKPPYFWATDVLKTSIFCFFCPSVCSRKQGYSKLLENYNYRDLYDFWVLRFG